MFTIFSGGWILYWKVLSFCVRGGGGGFGPVSMSALKKGEREAN